MGFFFTENPWLTLAAHQPHLHGVKVAAVGRTGIGFRHGLLLGGHALCVDYLLKWRRMFFAF